MCRDSTNAWRTAEYMVAGGDEAWQVSLAATSAPWTRTLQRGLHWVAWPCEGFEAAVPCSRAYFRENLMAASLASVPELLKNTLSAKEVSTKDLAS